MVGTQLVWAVVRDRDANIPQVIEEYRKEAAGFGISNLHIWDGYSVENLLLDQGLISAAIHSVDPDIELGTDQVVELLERAVGKVNSKVKGSFVTKTQAAYRKFEEPRSFDQAATDAINYLQEIDTIEQKLKYYPGKRIFGQFVQLLQNEHGINLRLDNIVAVLDAENAPEDIQDFVQMLRDV